MNAGGRWSWVVAMIAVAGTLLVFSCGGGGGGDSGGDSGTPAPQSLNYNIGSVDGVPVSIGETDWTCTVDNVLMYGTYEVSTKAVTADYGSRMGMSFGGAFAGQAPLNSWVQVPLAFVLGQPPTVGEQWVRYSAIAEVRTAVDNGLPGVEVRNVADGVVVDGPDPFQWDPFLAAATDPAAQPYQRDASLGFFALQSLYDQTAIGMEWLEFVENYGSSLQSAGGAGVTQPCDPFPGGPGTVTIVWTDANPNGSLGPGDTFTVTYDRCFVDVPGDDVDEILDGTVMLVGFIRNQSPFSIGGELRFDGFQRTETQTVGGIPTATEHVWTIDGALNLFFSGS